MPFRVGPSPAPLGVTNASPGYATDWHDHDCAMLLVPRAGALRVEMDAWGKPAYRVGPGEALAVAVGVGHRTGATGRRGEAQRHLALYAPAAALGP